jgi:hypothetical protein
MRVFKRGRNSYADYMVRGQTYKLLNCFEGGEGSQNLKLKTALIWS